MMSSDDPIMKKPLEERIRKIKVLTPGEYGLHAWLDQHHGNGLLIDTVLLTVANGGKLASGVPAT